MSRKKPRVPQTPRQRFKAYWETSRELQPSTSIAEKGFTNSIREAELSSTLAREMQEYSQEQMEYGADIRD